MARRIEVAVTCRLFSARSLSRKLLDFRMLREPLPVEFDALGGSTIDADFERVAEHSRPGDEFRARWRFLGVVFSLGIVSLLDLVH